MRTVFLLALAFVFVMSMAVPLYAADLHKSVDKFADGTVEILKSPLVLYDHTKSTMDEAKHKPIGLMKGLLESPFHMVKKAGGGILDIATFPVE
jgi:hypothetical protein